MGFLFLISGCVGNNTTDDMIVVSPTSPNLYSIATIQKITDSTAPIHIYIEGDGHAFDAFGQATGDPTPRTRTVRNMAMADKSPNVIYIARPCQFIMDAKCQETDWTTGRFSQTMVDSIAAAIKTIAGSRPVILIGYSGGAMISGLIIQNHSEINAIQWITLAGVLNHADWTQHFGDAPLMRSLNLNTLPRVPQVHYIAEHDKTVPNSLSRKWVKNEKIIVIPNATHNDLHIEKLDFIN